MKGSPESQALETLKQNASERFNPSMKQWKENGGKIIGLLYNYIPEEILTAANIFPYRIRALDSTSTVLAESRFMETNCSLVRHFYDSIARGDFPFCDGIVSVNSCDHERRLYDNLLKRHDFPYYHFMYFPKKQGEEQIAFFAEKLKEFLVSLENAFNITITEDDLRNAINLHNETRRLQRELYELRKSENPPLGGTDMLAVMMAASSTPRKEYNELLAQLLKDCGDVAGIKDYKMRVFVYGGEIDSVPFIETIESQGALVVGDYLGYGYRAAYSDVGNTGNSLYDLASNMIMDRPDPRIFGTAKKRQDFVNEQMNTFNATAVISLSIPMCDYWGYEKFNFGIYAETHDIPVLSLEGEYIFSGSGQIKTRVQAFVETHSERS